RLPSSREKASGLTFAEPGKSASPGVGGGISPGVSPHSVAPEAYGEFLVTIFDEWVRKDVGTMFVMNFEWALASFMRLPSTICLFAENCGEALIVEHNGDVYSCDHFMYPDHRLGNLAQPGLAQTGLAQLAGSAQQQAFGRAKSASLPDYCRR